jgi:cell division septal protein FtsQ
MTRRGVLIAGIAALLLAGLAVSPRALRKVDFFKIRRVEVRGARYLVPDTLVAALRLGPDASLFDRTAGLADRVFAIRGVAEARVTRRWPGTLVVTVREHQPVALAEHEGVLGLMDRRGWVLPFDPTRDPRRLPVADPDAAVALVLGRVMDAEPDVFTGIERAARVGKDILLSGGGHRYLLRSDATVRDIQALGAVVRDLAGRGRDFVELDARFTDRVFVRGMTL